MSNVLSKFARPVSCAHDSDVTYSIDDDYSDPTVLPIFSCGCRSVPLDMSRMYRPPSPEVIDLTSDDTVPLSDTASIMDIDEILDFVDGSGNRISRQVQFEQTRYAEFLRVRDEEHVRLRDARDGGAQSRRLAALEREPGRRERIAAWEASYLENMRTAVNNCLSQPYTMTLRSFPSDDPMEWGEFVDQHPTVRVKVDWVILRRTGVCVYDHTVRRHVTVPCDRHIDSAHFRLNYHIVCNACSQLPRVLECTERIHGVCYEIDVDFDENGTLTVGVDLMAKHWIARHCGKVLAAKFEIAAGGQASHWCLHCDKRPFNVVGPFDTTNVRFQHSRTDFVGHPLFDIDQQYSTQI